MKKFRICITLEKYEYYEVPAATEEEALAKLAEDESSYFVESSDGTPDKTEVIEVYDDEE